jgi:hypothetical protein
MDIMQAVNGFACIAALLLAIRLWRHEINREANRWLAALAFIVALIYVDIIVYYSSFTPRIPLFAFTFHWSLFLLGPLCYQYVKVLTTKKRSSFKVLLLHGLPSVCAFLVLFAAFYTRPIEVQQQMFQKDINPSEFSLFDLLEWATVPQLTSYWIASAWLVKAYRKRLSNLVFDVEALRLSWLTKLLITAAAFVIFHVLTVISAWRGFEYIRIIIPAMGICALSYMALNQSEVFVSNASVSKYTLNSIESAPSSHAGESAKSYSCFISYSSKDQNFADRLLTDLRANQVQCWFAPENLKIGDKYPERIYAAILQYDKLLVILSKASLASSWVEKEVLTALEKEKDQQGKPALFPICIDESMANAGRAWAVDIRLTRHIGDFSSWNDQDSYQRAFQRLLRDLQGEESKSVALE